MPYPETRQHIHAYAPFLVTHTRAILISMSMSVMLVYCVVRALSGTRSLHMIGGAAVCASIYVCLKVSYCKIQFIIHVVVT